MKKAATILAALGLIVALSACEPAVTMTLVPKTTRPMCGDFTSVSGTIGDNDTTTTSVVLQRRSGGTWQDWPNIEPSPLRPDRTFHIGYQAPYSDNAYAIRVRSQDNRNASATTYLQPISVDYPCS